MTRKTLLSRRERADQEQSIHVRAQEHLAALAGALAGRSKVVAYGVLDRGRVLDPAHKGTVDLDNPPLIPYTKVVFRSPVEDQTKYIPDAIEVFAAFMALVSLQMKELEHHRGEFWEALRPMAPAKICIEVVQFTRQKGYVSTILEHTVPRGAR